MKKIVICKADKGGSILIVPPALIERKVEEKLHDESLYEKLPKDPSMELLDKLFLKWKQGVALGFVSPNKAYKVAGVTIPDPENGVIGGNKSTASRFRPGIPYFYPMLKIHKLTPEQLKPGWDPPARLVTALKDGCCKRSDVFLAKKFFKDLERLYCGDLFKDTSSTLRWLDKINKNHSGNKKKMFKCFTFDFASLYDSLNPTLIMEALKHAIASIYDSWEEAQIGWVCDLVRLSIESSVGCYKGKRFRQRKGIATGGSICVELANITVFYVLNKILYSEPDHMMKSVESLKRYVDDCTGIFVGNEREFRNWEAKVRKLLLEFGLSTDDFVMKSAGTVIHSHFWTNNLTLM